MENLSAEEIIEKGIALLVQRELGGFEAPSRCREMKNFVTGLVFEIVSKYKEGALEHRDTDLTEINRRRETRKELIDALVYNESDSWEYSQRTFPDET